MFINFLFFYQSPDKKNDWKFFWRLTKSQFFLAACSWFKFLKIYYFVSFQTNIWALLVMSGLSLPETKNLITKYSCNLFDREGRHGWRKKLSRINGRIVINLSTVSSTALTRDIALRDILWHKIYFSYRCPWLNFILKTWLWVLLQKIFRLHIQRKCDFR